MLINNKSPLHLKKRIKYLKIKKKKCNFALLYFQILFNGLRNI